MGVLAPQSIADDVRPSAEHTARVVSSSQVALPATHTSHSRSTGSQSPAPHCSTSSNPERSALHSSRRSPEHRRSPAAAHANVVHAPASALHGSSSQTATTSKSVSASLHFSSVFPEHANSFGKHAAHSGPVASVQCCTEGHSSRDAVTRSGPHVTRVAPSQNDAPGARPTHSGTIGAQVPGSSALVSQSSPSEHGSAARHSPSRQT